jgi:inosine-uridine nucleoside N-ribohydrolase
LEQTLAPSATPLILDVDTGIDDAFALLYAIAQPSVRVIGVSSVAGNVDLTKATRNTRAVLALGLRPDIPVWSGAAAPILHAPEDASIVHGESGLGYAILPEPPAEAAQTHAIDAILRASHEHKGELVLVATGPLTNIAATLLRDGELPRRLKRFVLMGGAFREAGNVTPAAEFNIWHDPEAARIVFRAFGAEGAAPLVAVGLDVTRQTRIVEEDLAALAKRCAGLPRAKELMRFLDDSARYYFELMENWHGSRHLTMHDPLAIGAAIDPTLITTKQAAVDVEIFGQLTRGMTVADWRGIWKRSPNAEVALEVDAPRFLSLFFDAMERLARG